MGIRFIIPTVSSVHTAESCVPHIIAVKMPNNSDSNNRNIRNIVVAAGEYAVHSV